MVLLKISSLLAICALLAWQMMSCQADKVSLSQGAAATKPVGRRHADGTFTSDYNQLLDEIATKEFLKWLIESKVKERDLSSQYKDAE